MFPKTLSEIVGQPNLSKITNTKDHRGRCYMLIGPPGTGKTATAKAFCADYKVHDGFAGGLFRINGSDLTVSRVKELFGRELVTNLPLKVLWVEEFEWAHQQAQVMLKQYLDPMTGDMPKNLVVLATSNDTSKLDRALVQRFIQVQFNNTQTFRNACYSRLRDIWYSKTDEPFPSNYKSWGGDEFSMRIALQDLEHALSARIAA